MIIDDSTTSRIFIKVCLQSVFTDSNETDYIEAGDGREAQALLTKSQIDLAVIDLNMPVMNGIDLIRWMKSNPRLTNIPIIVTTSLANPARNKKLLELGVVGVLHKPITPTSLIPILSEIFNIQDDHFGFN